MTAQTYPFGYCTNVHAGTSLEQARANLLEYASAVRQRVCPDQNLPIGLWLAEAAADSLLERGALSAFRDWLAENSFAAYTMNGFPQGDFHQRVVKHRVYEPTWACSSRARYTMCLVEILDELLPPGATGSISTLPLGWPHAPWHAENFKEAADNLIEVAKFIDRVEQKSGREIVVAIESEPGCVLNTAAEMVEFFEHYLFRGPDAATVRRHIAVCHDICHSGVMFESQAGALELYRNSGMRIGKVQVSSAVHVPWDECRGDAERQAALLNQLKTLNEPKYLHQTTRSDGSGKLRGLKEDLSGALEQWLATEGEPPLDPWRIHFHVPIFVDRFEQLQTTHADIRDATSYLEQHADACVDSAAWFTGHYEVETYAWPVLPPELATESLSAGIAQELEYFSGILGR